MQYKDLVAVAPRFTRATNIERDANLPAAIDGYVLTKTAQDVLVRLGRALVDPVGHRAWSLLGSYGSGKSSFALYLSNIFGPRRAPAGALARSLLRLHSPGIFQEFFGSGNRKRSVSPGFLPVLVTGAAEPLLPALLRACCRDIRRHWTRGRTPTVLTNLERMRSALEREKTVNPSGFVENLVQIAVKLQQSGRSRGILLIIDELGKFLESASRDPERGDIYILQQLAEATARFRSGGLALLTILHQSFERYVVGLRPSVRDEWSKVQGRFEDIAFQEPPEQLLGLVASAIRQSNHSLVNALKQRARRCGERASALGLVPPGMNRHEFVKVMTQCAPLHPLTVVALIRLCRKFGQNERSLFSFLVSREPQGFSNFLLQDVSRNHLPFYCLPRLYDYVADALGNGLDVGESATRWVEVRSALDRSQGSSLCDIEVIKAVGLLSAIGSHGELKPSREVVEFCFGENTKSAKEACEQLLKKSVLVYRRHSSAYALWQGSDIDIESRLEEAKRRVIEGESLSKSLSCLWVPRPLVAKRHSFAFGTLRYFLVRFADAIEFSKALLPDPDADGIVLYCLPNSQGELQHLTDLAKSSTVRERLDVVVAVPRDVESLRESVRELELLRWVETNTPELAGDAVARREIRARLTIAAERVEHQIRSLFSPDEVTARRTAWFHRGIPQLIRTGRSLTYFLSDICDSVYKNTPRLRNELLNRRSLSSAAAKARRNLIDAMVTHRGEAELGITGTPPEKSMYVSVLGATKIHRLEGTGYDFGPPHGDPGLLQVWKAIEAFFTNCELSRRPLSELFSLLQRPPFGLKAGVIPVLFCAAALAHDTEVGLYEAGVFMPELTVEIFERLLRLPERFELRRFRVVGVRADVFRHFAKLLGTTLQSSDRHLVAIVRPLFRFFNRLPEYSKRTKTLTPEALAVREALFNASEPDILLFEKLPQACGFDPFLLSNAKAQSVLPFFQELKSAFAELQRAYDDLLTQLQHLLFGAFDVTGAKPREVVRFRAQALLEHVVDPRLRAFIHNLSDEQLDDVSWIEAVATLLVGKAPRMWLDADRSRYEVCLSELVRSFRHMEALAFELVRRRKLGRGPADVLRIGVTDRHSNEREAVVAVESEDQPKLADTVIQLEACLDRLAITSHPELALAALATVSRRFLSELENSESRTTEPRPEEVNRE